MDISATCRNIYCSQRRREVASEVEHSFTNRKVPKNVLMVCSYDGVIALSGEACFKHISPGVVHIFSKDMDVRDFALLCAQKDPRFLFEKSKGQPFEFGLLS